VRQRYLPTARHWRRLFRAHTTRPAATSPWRCCVYITVASFLLYTRTPFHPLPPAFCLREGLPVSLHPPAFTTFARTPHSYSRLQQFARAGTRRVNGGIDFTAGVLPFSPPVAAPCPLAPLLPPAFAYAGARYCCRIIARRRGNSAGRIRTWRVVMGRLGVGNGEKSISISGSFAGAHRKWRNGA